MPEPLKSEGSIEIFCSYSHEDEKLRRDFETALAVLRHRSVQIWHDRRIRPGKDWTGDIDEHLNTADIIVLLVSADFLASDYCDKEMARALEREKHKEAVVVPIIVRPCDWEESPFAYLQAIPAKPVTAWRNRDQAWTSVAKSMALLVREIYIRKEQMIEDQITRDQEIVRDRIASVEESNRDVAKAEALRSQILAEAAVQAAKREQVRTELQSNILGIEKEFLRVDKLLYGLLAAFVAICILVTPELYLRNLWTALAAVAAIGATAIVVLVRKRNRIAAIRRPRKQLSSRQRYLVLASALLGMVFLGLFAWHLVTLYRSQLRLFYFHSMLERFSLPRDLYDRQNQIESLTIDQRLENDSAGSGQSGVLTDLSWLDSTSLTDLTIASPGLSSLNGLSGVTDIQSLTLNLNQVPMASLDDLSVLRRLRGLVLSNIGRTQMRLVPQLNAFPELRNLELDFKYSPIPSIPDLTSCRELENIALDLRSTTRIFDLPDLSGFPQLRSVSLLLDYSRVQHLARVGNLDSLTLSLDGTQVPLLADLRNGTNLRALKLGLSTPPNDPFPDLRGIPGLISLTLYMPGERGGRFRDGTAASDRTSVPDITHLNQLQELAIYLNSSDIQELPPIGQMTALRNLYLDLRSSGIGRLPDISQLRNLDRLMLNVNDTGVRDFPDLARFPRLRYLSLGLAGSRGTNPLRGIETLNMLETLELDLRRSSIQDLSAILSLGSLKTLVLHLGWDQVRELPNLARLRNLTTLELQLDGWWSAEDMPDLSGLQSLEQITLDLKGAHIRKLPDFLKFSHLWKVTLDLDNSDIDDLSPLADIAGLKELYLDLRHTPIKTVPDLRSLKHLQKVVAAVSHSSIRDSQLGNFANLEELEIDKSFLIKNMPDTVRKLAIGP